MPITIGIDQDIVTLAIKGLSKAVTQLEKDTAYALRSTVTRTAAMGRARLNNELKTQLDRPVPFIYRAYFFQPAKDLDNPVARILVGGGFTPGSKADYIDSITRTGEYVEGRMTKRLRRSGVIRHSEVALPTRRLKRTPRGNISGPNLNKVIHHGIAIKKGKYRGLYQIQRGKFVKVFTPGRTPRKYSPRVNVEVVLKSVIDKFDVMYNEQLQKNIRKSLAKSLRK